MSFCKQVKTEISEISSRNGCCSVAHLYGMLLFSKVFSLSRIVVSSEHEVIILHIKDALIELGIKAEILEEAKTARDYSIKITDKKTLDRLFFDFGYTGEEPNTRIIKENFLCDECVAAFVAGCFMTGGNITDPEKGYHLEFSTHKTNLFNDLSQLLESAGFQPRKTKRGYAKILYYKNSGQIEDMLTYIGAVDSSLKLMDTKIYKEIVNSVNRRTNCENANIDKLVHSAGRDKAAIEFIYKTKGKGYLPEDLREVAKLRLENPELPLSELGDMLEKPLTKSGISHRLRRIRQEAGRLRDGEK